MSIVSVSVCSVCIILVDPFVYELSAGNLINIRLRDSSLFQFATRCCVPWRLSFVMLFLHFQYVARCSVCEFDFWHECRYRLLHVPKVRKTSRRGQKKTTSEQQQKNRNQTEKPKSALTLIAFCTRGCAQRICVGDATGIFVLPSIGMRRHPNGRTYVGESAQRRIQLRTI